MDRPIVICSVSLSVPTVRWTAQVGLQRRSGTDVHLMLVERTPRSAARAPAAQAAAAQPIAEEPTAPTVEPVELVVDKDAMLEEMESMFEMAVVKVVCTALFCCAVLCCAVLCCAVLCCAVLCCAVLCCAVCGCVCACTRARNSCVWSFMRSRQIWARVFCGLLFRFGGLANAVDRNVSLRESIAHARSHAYSHAHACKATHPFRAHFALHRFGDRTCRYSLMIALRRMETWARRTCWRHSGWPFPWRSSTEASR